MKLKIGFWCLEHQNWCLMLSYGLSHWKTLDLWLFSDPSSYFMAKYELSILKELFIPYLHIIMKDPQAKLPVKLNKFLMDKITFSP